MADGHQTWFSRTFGNGNRPITLQTMIQLGTVVGVCLMGWIWLDSQFGSVKNRMEETWRIDDQVRWQERFEKKNPDLEMPSSFEVWKRHRLDIDQIEKTKSQIEAADKSSG